MTGTMAPTGSAPPPGPPATRHAAGVARRHRAVSGVLGVAGELLITAGVLLGLFLVWQLWWTDVVADAEHERVVASLGWARTAADVPDASATDPSTEQEPTAQPPAPAGRQDPAPVLPEPAHGTTFATLQVPRWGPGYVQPISQGTSRPDVLDVLGLGHYEGTAMPGGIGNFAVAGHRTTYGEPLNRVEELQLGDALVVQTEETWYVYRITSTEVVGPQQVEVIAPVPGRPGEQPTEAAMTLTTCHPMFSARQRFIVHATLDYWLPVTDGIPAELTAPVATGGA